MLLEAATSQTQPVPIWFHSFHLWGNARSLGWDDGWKEWVPFIATETG